MLRHFFATFTSIVRNPFLSVVTILCIAFALIILNTVNGIHQLTNERINSLSQEVRLNVYLKPEVSENTLANTIAELEKNRNITSLEIISPEKALEQVSQRYPGSSDFLEEYKISNPLPTSVQITTTTPEAQKEVLSQLQKTPYDNYFTVDNEFEERSPIRAVVNNLLKLKTFTNQALVLITLVFTIGGILLIFNAIRITLHSRRKEIQIMQLVGATHNHIRMPFILEAAIFAIFGFILSSLLTFSAPYVLPENLSEAATIITTPTFISTLTQQIIALIIIAILTSFVTVENYLRKRSLFD